MQLDLGGIGKGFAADAALAVLASSGAPRCLVNHGGDIAAGDAPPGATGWRVALDAAAGTMITLCNDAVATSGDAEQFVEFGGVRYSHIVDPSTGLGLTHRTQVTVIADDATTADALASALSVMGPERTDALLRSFPTARATFVGPRSR